VKPSPVSLIGRSPDSLTIQERAALAGQWIALEIYSPVTLPLRLIAASGPTVADCVRSLQERALDPAQYEYCMIQPAISSRPST